MRGQHEVWAADDSFSSAELHMFAKRIHTKVWLPCKPTAFLSLPQILTVTRNNSGGLPQETTTKPHSCL